MQVRFQMDFYLHHGISLCRSWVPSSPYAELYASLVCGLDLPNGKDKSLFIETGLIHILVVSGAHLAFLDRCGGFLPTPLRLAMIGLYGWLTDFGTPIVRALVKRLCAITVRDWGWTPLQTEALTSTLILLVFPHWLLSRSFLMSWLCALAMNLPLPVPRWRPLNTSLRCYALLFPFCAASPLTILWNCLLGPSVGEILFPCSILGFICPPLTPLIDFLWSAFLWILQNGPKASPIELWWNTADLVWIPTVTHTLLLIGEWRWRRALAFLP